MPLLETKGAASAQGFGEFAKVGAANYIEDVFSTYLYTGNGSTQTITNGIDLAGKGGLVWSKARSSALNHFLCDTARGRQYYLITDATVAQQGPSTAGRDLSTFNSNGFSLGVGEYTDINTNAVTYASWTFRKQPKFFDVVTYTGNGATSRNISHSLGSDPGCIIVKRTSGSGSDWSVYHRSTGTGKRLILNQTLAVLTDVDWFASVTSTTFSVSGNTDANDNGETYVAYLFAHDAGGFGATGADNVISCGSFTTDGSGYSPDVNLGYEPQWVLLKPSGGTGDWLIVDTMRGWVNPAGTAADDANLRPNKSDAEATNDIGWPTATGFNAGYRGTANNQWIYIAIRRGPMKTPTTGTSVYEGTTRNGTGAAASISGLAFPPDAVLTRNRDSNSSSRYALYDKLRGPTIYLDTAATDAEFTVAQSLTSFNQTGESFGTGVISNANGEPYINWQFRRAPGFFDVVCYSGSSSNTTQTHNLGVVPEMIIVKSRNNSRGWPVYTSPTGAGNFLFLNSTDESAGASTYWNNTTPTASVFSLGTAANTNNSGDNYVAYLFATLAGVSKVGSYTGTGNTLQINCGFTGGARFVLIKRTDVAGAWYVWDSARGIVSGNDSYLVLNSTAAEVTNTDWVDTYSAGFELSNAAGNNVNINTATYIFLSVA